MHLTDSPALRFGTFELNLESGKLYKRGMLVRLQEQPLQILITLLEQPGCTVTREELQHKLWPGGVGFEESLNTAVKKLRAALGDSADDPAFVETVPTERVPVPSFGFLPRTARVRNERREHAGDEQCVGFDRYPAISEWG